MQFDCSYYCFEQSAFCILRLKNPVSITRFLRHFSLAEKIYLLGDETCLCSASAVSPIRQKIEISIFPVGFLSPRILCETRVLFRFGTLPVSREISVLVIL